MRSLQKQSPRRQILLPLTIHGYYSIQDILLTVEQIH